MIGFIAATYCWDSSASLTNFLRARVRSLSPGIGKWGTTTPATYFVIHPSRGSSGCLETVVRIAPVSVRQHR